MNFNYTEDQQAIKDVAEKIFSDLGTDEIIKSCFDAEQPFYKELWAQLASSGLLAATLSSEFGGSELGFTELCLIIEGQGGVVAPIPLVETVVECAMPIAEFGSAELKQRLLPGVASGEILLSAVRPYEGLRGLAPLAAEANGEGFLLNGCSSLVTYAPIANGYLVTANTADKGKVVVYCESNASGLTMTEQRAMSAELAGHVKFENVAIDSANVVATGDEADALIEWVTQRTYVALAAQQVGVLKSGVKRAAEYTSERTQFGKPLATFQAVAQQVADAYMAIEALRGVYWRALDDLDQGRKESELSSRVAKFWVCEAGHIAAHVFLHVHGGIGQDLEYPVHRFFIWAKKNEVYLGAASKHSVQLGDMIKADPERVAI